MHFISVVRVSGVHWVIPKGRPAPGNVWPFSSEPVLLFRRAQEVIAGAVPISGSTYCKRTCAVAESGHRIIIIPIADNKRCRIMAGKLFYTGDNKYCKLYNQQYSLQNTCFALS